MVVSAKVSPTPSRNIAPSTTRDVDLVGDDGADQDGARRPPGTGRQTATSRRRSTRSATTPANRPKRRNGRYCSDRSERDQERVARLRGDEQRAGRDLEAVGDVAHPARGRAATGTGCPTEAATPSRPAIRTQRSMLAERPLTPAIGFPCGALVRRVRRRRVLVVRRRRSDCHEQGREHTDGRAHRSPSRCRTGAIEAAVVSQLVPGRSTR